MVAILFDELRVSPKIGAGEVQEATVHAPLKQGTAHRGRATLEELRREFGA